MNFEELSRALIPAVSCKLECNTFTVYSHDNTVSASFSRDGYIQVFMDGDLLDDFMSSKQGVFSQDDINRTTFIMENSKFFL
jgi:hypothetical protein